VKILEIFNSLEGEGMRQGLPTTFIRFSGCSIHCSFCDTKESWDQDLGAYLPAEMILKKIKMFKTPFINITGGNPFEQDSILMTDLIYKLVLENFNVCIEHPGIVLDTEREFNILNLATFVSFDMKPPSSGITKLHYHNLELKALMKEITPISQLKCVINTVEDLDYYEEELKDIKNCPIFLQLGCKDSMYTDDFLYTKIPLIEEIKSRLLEGRFLNCKLGIQLHKMLNFE
jgi:7-carboxy-7-deazaguanine synthase